MKVKYPRYGWRAELQQVPREDKHRLIESKDADSQKLEETLGRNKAKDVWNKVINGFGKERRKRRSRGQHRGKTN